MLLLLLKVLALPLPLPTPVQPLQEVEDRACKPAQLKERPSFRK
jgi:hypothetical protein